MGCALFRRACGKESCSVPFSEAAPPGRGEPRQGRCRRSFPAGMGALCRAECGKHGTWRNTVSGNSLPAENSACGSSGKHLFRGAGIFPRHVCRKGNMRRRCPGNRKAALSGGLWYGSCAAVGEGRRVWPTLIHSGGVSSASCRARPSASR